MEKKTRKEIVKISFVAITVTYLVLVGPVSLIHNGDYSKNKFLSNLKEPKAYGATILSIPEKYKYLAPGDELVVETQLHQFRFGRKTDVIIDYEIQNTEGEIILRQHETVAIQTQASFLKTFNLPENMGFERYIVFGTIKDLELSTLATSTASFEITKPILGYQQSQFAWVSSKNILVGISLVLVFFLIFLFAITVKEKKQTDTKGLLGKKIEYQDLIEAIIKHNYFFGKMKAIGLANRIKGLQVSPEGKIIKLDEKGLETMINLIDLYRISIGQSSIKIAREAIRSLLTSNPKLVIPKELKIL